MADFDIEATVDNGEYLTLAEAALELRSVRVSRRTLTRYAQAGHLGAIRVGRDYRIPRSVVERIKVEGLRKAAGA